MGLLIAVILIIVIIVLIFYIMHMKKMLDMHKNLNEKVNNLSVLQNFMDVAGEEETVEAKIKKINEIIIEKYEIKYSTIVVFNGAEYEIKASNVEEKHWDTLKNLQSEKVLI